MSLLQIRVKGCSGPQGRGLKSKSGLSFATAADLHFGPGRFPRVRGAQLTVQSPARSQRLVPASHPPVSHVAHSVLRAEIQETNLSPVTCESG